MTGLPLSPDERGGCALETDGLFITIQVRQAKLGRTNSGRSYIVKKSTYD